MHIANKKLANKFSCDIEYYNKGIIFYFVRYFTRNISLLRGFIWHVSFGRKCSWRYKKTKFEEI